MRKFSVDQPIQMRRDRRLIEALDDFVQEAGDDEALSDFCRDTTRMEIKHFLFVDLARRGAVSAADVISQNFEAGHRVRLGVVAQKKVANFLVGVGEMGVRFDANQSAECAAGAIVERIFVKQITGGVRRYVILQRPGVEFLFVRRDGDRQQIASRAFAHEPAQTFEARIS